VRLAEVVGALSLAADVSAGCALEKGIRTVVIASRLAHRLGATNEERTQTFWIAALRNVACTAFAPDAAAFAAGDDISARNTLFRVDFDRPVEAFLRIVRGFAPEASVIDRARGIARFVLDREIPRRFANTHCEAGMFFARSLAMSEEITRGLGVTGERFDGKGHRGTYGDELPYGARVSDVADVLEMFWWADGSALATRELEHRRGRSLDPRIVDVATRELPELTEQLRDSVWDAYLEAEPERLTIAGEQIDAGCVALGLFADLTSLHTLAHSRRVAGIVDAAGAASGISDDARALARRAGSVHDLGRVAVASGTWDKKGPLNALEWQRVCSHSHQTEAVLRAAGLDELAAIAGATHERGGGAGYHKGLALDGVPFLAKLVAAADVMAALGEDRPHRPRLALDRAAVELRSLVKSGALDARAVQAVLDAQGVRAPRKKAWPGGLSDREVEVVRMVAVGRTNKDIGVLLRMSPRTAQKHVMNVYDKLGLESRAGLALYALEHGLLDDDH
jgi:HD-GYP domain-containing protein (c-di-GMP phosphodiesterase class II)